ncbi:serine protease inhibitor Cvsi-2-like [Ostrea edulis]|uniref:serine protease inhibitor Cvsi-2-like n=1 Tax=Ostrea edulis TaxID=37623 RepID=UPI0024AF55BE|nr:serine protease inhibitor Cvsi-2-like [Ostrea edulis]
MKAIFVLAAVIVAVSSEMCRDDSSCSVTSCNTGSTLHCIQHQCTCTVAASGDGGCTMATDCSGRCDHGREHHCIDGRCRCTHHI